MSKETVTYYFGRLNLIAIYESKRDFLLQSLNTDKVISRYHHNWGFFEIKSLVDNLFGELLTGFLVKYKDEDREEKVDEATHTIAQEDVEDRVKAKARFFLHIKSGLIAFHPIGGEITREQFRQRFCELIEESNEGLFTEAAIVYIEERGRFFELIRSLSEIKAINIWLHPSNPSNADKWEKIDQRLKRLRAKEYRESYNTHPDLPPSTVENDEEIAAKVWMAEDGYGEVAATGTSDGQAKRVSTLDNPVTAQSFSDKFDTNTIFSRLKGSFESIFSRFTPPTQQGGAGQPPVI